MPSPVITPSEPAAPRGAAAISAVPRVVRVRFGLARLLTTLALTTAMGGCSNLRMTVVDSQEQVLHRRTHTVPNDTVKVRRDLDITRLTVVTTRGCDLVQTEEVEKIEYLEANEDPTEEWTLFGVLTAPIVSGAVLLADAGNVYDNDRNSRLYNPVGQTGAYVGGGVLLGVGLALASLPFAQLIRISVASEENKSTFTRRGKVLQQEVGCDDEPAPLRASVSLRAGSTRISRNTDQNGQLFLDLAEAVRPTLAQQHENLELYVANRLIEVIPMSVVRDEQQRRRERRDEDTWSRARVGQCRAASSADTSACAGVKAYLRLFPNGQYAEQARMLLESKKALTVATDGEGEGDDGASTEALLQRAKEEAARSCSASCKRNCAAKGRGQQALTCERACLKEVCQ